MLNLENKIKNIQQTKDSNSKAIKQIITLAEKTATLITVQIKGFSEFEKSMEQPFVPWFVQMFLNMLDEMDFISRDGFIKSNLNDDLNRILDDKNGQMEYPEINEENWQRVVDAIKNKKIYFTQLTEDQQTSLLNKHRQSSPQEAHNFEYDNKNYTKKQKELSGNEHETDQIMQSAEQMIKLFMQQIEGLNDPNLENILLYSLLKALETDLFAELSETFTNYICFDEQLSSIITDKNIQQYLERIWDGKKIYDLIISEQLRFSQLSLLQRDKFIDFMNPRAQNKSYDIPKLKEIIKNDPNITKEQWEDMTRSSMSMYALS